MARLNYRTIAALAARRNQIEPDKLAEFVAAHGMPGFAPTQGHFASALPYMAHALEGLRAGTLQAKIENHKLFLGGDVVLAVGDVVVEASETAMEKIRAHVLGLKDEDLLKVKVLREGKIITLERRMRDIR